MQPDQNAFEQFSCPLPLTHNESIVIGHGSGGRMTHDLVKKVFYKHFSNPVLDAGNDFARVSSGQTSRGKGKIVLSTDCHIISPLFFPGGDIGRLAVCGTVNDVAMSGAQPLYITAGFIIEEGFSIEMLEKVVSSMSGAAQEANVLIVAGDTKVVEKGNADSLFITTTGIGWLEHDLDIAGDRAAPGDVVLISGTIGDHGVAVLTARNELGIETTVQSDVAPLNGMIDHLLQAAPHTHVLRDPTRGGLATTLNEIAAQSKVAIWIDEETVPILPEVRSVCELLGFDPLYMANEGKLVAIVPPEEADNALNAMRQHPYGKMAMRIGAVQPTPQNRVMAHTTSGATRILDMLSGEMLPRIC
ncbi:MAG: hydrogenase expression/formation protein HypE [Anaerolineae bacterium]|nr:hydrogenase expression/formation protein HypE [Anaerolineae bacterium]